MSLYGILGFIIVWGGIFLMIHLYKKSRKDPAEDYSSIKDFDESIQKKMATQDGKVSEPFSPTTNDEIPSHAAGRSCENCLTGRYIKPYHFYIGKKISEKTKRRGIPLYYWEKKTTTEYLMAPDPAKAYICDDCIESLLLRDRKYFKILVGCYLLCLVPLLVWDSGGIGKFIIIGLSAICIFPGIILYLSSTRTEDEVGTSLAIALARKRMNKLDFDSFFTSSQYSNLTKKRS